MKKQNVLPYVTVHHIIYSTCTYILPYTYACKYSMYDVSSQINPRITSHYREYCRIIVMSYCFCLDIAVCFRHSMAKRLLSTNTQVVY
jgi:hypothetical protein